MYDTTSNFFRAHNCDSPISHAHTHAHTFFFVRESLITFKCHSVGIKLQNGERMADLWCLCSSCLWCWWYAGWYPRRYDWGSREKTMPIAIPVQISKRVNHIQRSIPGLSAGGLRDPRAPMAPKDLKAPKDLRVKEDL